MSATRPKVLIVLCCGVLAACTQKLRAPEPGMELYALPPENITEVVFSSFSRKLYAVRWNTGEAFQIVTMIRNVPGVEHCTGGGGFDQWLRGIATVKIERVLDKPADNSPSDWADVLLRDATNLEPIRLRVRVPPTDSEPVIIDFQGRLFISASNGAALRTIASGCSKLKPE